MPGTSLIGDYLTALSAQLPAPIVEELADGLEQTRLHYWNRAWIRMPRPARRWRSSGSRT